MAKGKPPFAPVPVRAIRPLTYFNRERVRDEELTALDLRVLMCIGWHDRLSISKGSKGCFAGNELMAAEVGCTMQSLSRSISHLIAAGLIERDRQGVPGKRHLTVYRVLYDENDTAALAETVHQLGNRQLPEEVSISTGPLGEIVTQETAELAQSLIRACGKTLSSSKVSLSQETSPREGIDSSEDEVRNSSEEARFAARGSAG